MVHGRILLSVVGCMGLESRLTGHAGVHGVWGFGANERVRVHGTVRSNTFAGPGFTEVGSSPM